MKKKSVSSSAEKIVDRFHLPRDICAGAICISLTGDREAWIENYRGILEYTDTSILLQSKNCRVCLEGEGLAIDYYTNEDMKISGLIRCVKYL